MAPSGREAASIAARGPMVAIVTSILEVMAMETNATSSNLVRTPATVLICGAGPVGLTLAAELARYGVAVRIVDKAAEPSDKSKALVLWSRTLELLERGIGADRFVAAGFAMTGMNIMAGDRQIGRIDLSHIATPYPYALMLPQSDTERLLAERLAEFGVTVERAVEMTRIELRDDGVEATLTHAGGREEQVAADWLVGCDGAHSLVRHTIGAAFDGETNPSDWMLADVHMTGYPLQEDEAATYWHHDGVFVIFPISPGRYRLIADQPSSGDVAPPTPSLDEVQAIADHRGPGGLKLSDPIWLSGFRINERKVKTYRKGRTFLAGDAAHIHSPAGGQGMNTGMQDAFNLAWKLALVIHGTCDERLLDSYSPERSSVGDEVLKAATRLTAIGTLHNPVAHAVRNAVGHVALGLRPVQEGIAEQMSETTINYRDSPLNGPDEGHPKPGERWVPVTGEVTPGAGDRPCFLLLAPLSAESEVVAAQFARLVEWRPVAEPSATAILIRPDGYVAAVSDDLAQIEAYLGDLSVEVRSQIKNS
jgi:2-polyprenyl-6-methoxyphenol hydroxylase-like FAD-dependent oxidoreductase